MIGSADQMLRPRVRFGKREKFAAVRGEHYEWNSAAGTANPAALLTPTRSQDREDKELQLI
jgi:hypothetical protein